MNRLSYSFLCLILFFGLMSDVVARNNPLDGPEQMIVKSIDDNKQANLALLEKVVNINSGTMNFSGVKNVGRVFKYEFEKLGFATQWIDGKAFNRAGHLYASYGLQNNKPDSQKILMIGHLDTVFAENSAFQSYKTLDDYTVSGPGITDMKGGNVIIISVLQALKDVGVLDNLQIKVLLMGDEEKRGAPYSIATKELVEAGQWADIAMGFEDGDGNPRTAVISRRGAVGWKLNVKGRPAHSSQIFREGYGDGAIFEAARILNQFRTKLSTVPNLTFNPGVIVGGTDVEYDKAAANGTAFGKANVIAQSTTVNGDIRALSPQQLKKAKAVMKKIISQNLAETSAEIEFFDGYPPMAPNDGNRQLLASYNDASIDLGYGKVLAVDPRKAGAADISFVANHVEMALDGLGLMGRGGHTVNEVADIDTLTSQAHRAAVVMYRLSKK
ncbi:MAG: M20/M25/M40 family metallo-hydrolase [Kangiellaceae bacterium]|nr:M20/M25/M40 family metallo-hydrolase [Kangiellaceae bacterium]